MNTPPLPKLLESKAYERAVTAWDGPRITIISPANKAIAHIPLNFVIQGGDNTWAYVIGVARQLVVEDDGWIFDGLQAVNSVDPPFAGTFVYSSQGRNSVNYSSGPFYTTPYKPAEVDGSQSSHRSYATTPNAQASFRELVRIRDTCCSLTGTLFFSCEAAHIIPKSRPDVYRAILGLRDEEPVSEMFQASAGLLLRPDLHKAFDNLDISLYYKDGMIYAHSFRLHDAMQYHGMAIPSTRWHIPISEYWPKPEFLQWHYRQCLMARFRGFSAA